MMVKSIYKAFRSVDIPEEQAIDATDQLNHELSGLFDDIKEQQRIQASRVEFLKWAVVFVGIVVAGIVVRIVFQ